jgi:hypothetical protein
MPAAWIRLRPMIRQTSASRFLFLFLFLFLFIYLFIVLGLLRHGLSRTDVIEEPSL